MKTTKVHRPVILITAAALVLGLGAVGAAAAWGNRSDRSTDVSAAASRTGSATVEPIVAHPSRSASPAPSRPSPSVKPSPDPTRLADGVYPTYVRGVEVQGSTITVDVLQTFFGADAHRAATEDGVDWGDVRYDPVYIRNENPLLRTLPVARGVKIKLLGMCMAPNRTVGLTELRRATTPFTDTFYYDITVAGGIVERVEQLVAVSAC